MAISDNAACDLAAWHWRSEGAADDEIARALIQKRNPVIEANRIEADQKGWVRGWAKGHVEGKAEGREEGREEGRQEGREEGRHEAPVEAVLETLRARGIALDDADRVRIAEERDPARLRVWIGRAARCREAREIFAEG